jgi:hypothetical protein
MARYRKIDVRIWNDQKFRSLSDNAKLAFFLVLTHPDTTPLGMLRSRPVALAYELGWQADAMSDAIEEACLMGMLMVDVKAGLMVAPNFLKYNPPNGPNSLASWGELIDLMPECPLRDESLRRLKPFLDSLSDGMKKGIPDALKDAIRDAMSTASNIQEQEQEQEQEQDIAACEPPPPLDDDQDEQKQNSQEKASRSKRTRLTIEVLPDDWREYCAKVAPEIDPNKAWEDFKDYWQVKAKDPLSADWKRTWQSNVRKLHSGPDWMKGHLMKASVRSFKNAKNVTQTAEYRERLQACCRGEGRNEKLADDGVTIIVD